MDESPPVVSVCVANYNGMAYIDACLRSVLEQDVSFSIEIIVHDDASTDGSVAHIRTHYPQVVVIESSANVGFCVANNRMAEKAKGQYLLLLNNDAELFSDAIGILFQEAQSCAQPSVLGLPQYDATTGMLIDRGSLFDPFLNPFPNLDPQRSDVGMIIGACFWIPRSLWISLGGFPEWFGSMAEDMYLSSLARLQGYPVRALTNSGFRHWVGASFGGGKVRGNKLVTSAKRRALSERNKTYVMALTYPPPLLYAILPLHFTLLMFEGVLLALIKMETKILKDIYLNCFIQLWRERARLRQLRRQIQTGRAIGIRDFLKTHTLIPHKLRMLIRHGMPKVT
ncbi:glycosyltransferase [Janthinobacterium sp. 17J80-10]|uniref:glycosyltransferase family 2 protein n=1 Tax=Janthinobacterium sp. 17J80-10 TaxID=2497863 RepID=UPI0013E8CC5D|nr:glycosyltransferase [Janthinobacterium sp. 17J80-10]